jgi:hypothetical protein
MIPAFEVAYFSTMTAKFKTVVNRLPPSTHLSEATAGGLDRDIQAIALQCREVAEEITKLLGNFTRRAITGARGMTIGGPTRVMMVKPQLEALQRRLSILKEQLGTQILPRLR